MRSTAIAYPLEDLQGWERSLMRMEIVDRNPCDRLERHAYLTLSPARALR